MGNTTLRDEFNSLRASVNSFLGSQGTWNQKHDEHSREVLGKLDEKIDKLFSMQEKQIESFGKLNCAEHSTRMDLRHKLSGEKIRSVEKRLAWVWGVMGFSLVALALKKIYAFVGG